MPTVLNVNGFRFSFFAADCVEPRHVHVRKNNAEAKYWLEPTSQAYNHGFNRSEQRQIERIIREHHAELIRKWNEFCNA